MTSGSERVDVTARLMDLFELRTRAYRDVAGDEISEWVLRGDAAERVAWFRNLAEVPEPLSELGVREIARYVYGVVPEPCSECGRDRVTDAHMTSVRRAMRRLGIT